MMVLRWCHAIGHFYAFVILSVLCSFRCGCSQIGRVRHRCVMSLDECLSFVRSDFRVLLFLWDPLTWPSNTRHPLLPCAAFCTRIAWLRVGPAVRKRRQSQTMQLPQHRYAYAAPAGAPASCIRKEGMGYEEVATG